MGVELVMRGVMACRSSNERFDAYSFRILGSEKGGWIVDKGERTELYGVLWKFRKAERGKAVGRPVMKTVTSGKKRSPGVL